MPDRDLRWIAELETFDLDEDLAQTKLPNGDIIDVGWYPSGDPLGNFKARHVVNGDWQNPVSDFRTRDLDEVQTWWMEKLTAGGL